MGNIVEEAGKARASTKSAPKASPAAKKAADKEAPKETKPSIVRIVGGPEKDYRANSARALYWERFKEYDGKPLKDLEASCMDPKTCPAMPKKGSGAQKPEKFSGWLSFFQTNGMVKVERG